MIDNFLKGQILLGNRRKHPDAIHPILFLRYNEKHSTSFFIGLMLTKSGGEDNIKMRPEHFTEGFMFNDTHVVNAVLVKPLEWGPFKQIGSLSDSGIQFIDGSFPVIDEGQLWEEYLKRKR